MATFYIQLQDKLLQISGELTAENISKALGYVPVSPNVTNELSQRVDNITFDSLKDNPFLQDGSGELNIVDEAGNIIAKIDVDGIHSVDFIAGEHKLSNKTDKTYVDEAVKNVKVDLTGYATEEYVNNIDFYNINNNPIVNNGDGKLLFVDENGYIGLQLEEDGLYVKDVIADGYTLSQKADKSDIPSLDGYATESYVNTELENYATKEDIKDIASNSTIIELSGKVSTLIGEDADKSVRDIAVDALTETLVSETASEAYDTLAEMSAWIKSHPEDASAMNTAIQKNATDITNLDAAYKAADAKVLTDAQEYTDNINFFTIKDNPIIDNNDGNLTFVDESGNIGLQLEGDVLYVKDVITDNHILSEKANKNYVDEEINQINAKINSYNTTTQTIELSKDWNWVSFYVETSLEKLQNALGTNGIEIKHMDFTTSYDEESGLWLPGDNPLTTIEPSNMYMINANSDCVIELEGKLLEDVEITLNPGVNWIAYPLNVPMDVTMALINLEVTDGDEISSDERGFAGYLEGWGWDGNLSTLKPGQGYIYTNNSSETKTFKYPTELDIKLLNYETKEDSISKLQESKDYTDVKTDELRDVVTQTLSLPSGNNLYSFYVDITLEQLQQALGTNATKITTSFDGSTEVTSYYNADTNTWSGDLTTLDITKMYQIYLNTDCEIHLTGRKIPNSTIYTLNPGWNWIGYPAAMSATVEEALANHVPTDGDRIKSKSFYSEYFEGEWWPSFNLQAGQGYMYQNASNESKTLVFTTELIDTKSELNKKQDVLVSGTNIKTVNGESLLGEGNIDTTSPSVSKVGTLFTIGYSDNLISNNTEFIQQTSPLTQRQRACVYGNGYYVTAGLNGELAYTKDTILWTSLTPFTSNVITGLAYGKGCFIALDSGGNLWKSIGSPTEWSQIPISFDVILEALVYSNGKFIIVGAAGLIALSNNGDVWEIKNSNITNAIYAITYGDGKYVAVGANGTILYSYNGVNWNTIVDDFTGSYRSCTYGNGLFIIGGQNGVIKYSTDAISWTTAESDSISSVNYIRGIVYLEKKYYAVMYISTGAGEIWISDNGNSWRLLKSTSERLWAIAKSDNVLFTSGDNGCIYTLDLNLNWSNNKPESINNDTIWQKPFVRLSDGDIVYGESYVSLNLSKLTSNTPSRNSAYALVEHGTNDTTYTLTPNTFHVWGEVGSLTLTFGEEQSGVANEFLFQFESGETATTLTLPDDLIWANDDIPVIESNYAYQVSILKGFAAIMKFKKKTNLIENKLTTTNSNLSSTFTFEYPVASDISVTFTSNFGDTDTVTIYNGNLSGETDPTPGYNSLTNNNIDYITPEKDSVYIYTF